MRTLTPPATPSRQPRSLCTHKQPCPSAASPDQEAAVVIAAHPEQGWSLLCNGALLFDDTGVLADGRVIDPHRPFTATA
ncbi:DUF5999 family protein [Streptomyces ortus]|uniref:DUF5999 family protein n=1 Tax=Streptomyces ortus TaxID=2867268 RepID=A0ABT3UW30_9ACTN|nr:DUF5999 family protein [Streptomyces ortus]MCX4231764.1 DUF5999 family protein [Streptomyces ortus]